VANPIAYYLHKSPTLTLNKHQHELKVISNYWRKNDHIDSSAALKKNISAISLTMRVRIFQPQCCCVRRRVAHGLCRNRFHSNRRKVRHHV